MRWTVVWLPSAEDDLAAIWLASSDCQRITQAAHYIDNELRTDSDTKGEDFYGDRIIQYGPLAVAYMLSPTDRLVRVMQVMQVKD